MFYYEKLCFQYPQPAVVFLSQRASRYVALEEGDPAPILSWNCECANYVSSQSLMCLIQRIPEVFMEPLHARFHPRQWEYINNTKPLLVQGERQHMDQYVKIHQHENVLEKRKARRRDWLLVWGLQFPLEKLTKGFLVRFLLRRELKDLKKSNAVSPGNTKA